MGLLSSITDAIGLTDTGAMEAAAQAAQFNPYNVESSYGSLGYNPATRTFTSSISPDIQRLQAQQLFRAGSTDPALAQLQRGFFTGATAEDPRLSALQSRYFDQLGQVSPTQELDLFRQQAAPYNQAASQAVENRLFSQGRLDHSQAYRPGGVMRGLWDAQAQQDLGFQQQAIQNARAREAQLLGQFSGVRGLQSQEQQQALGNYTSLFGMQDALRQQGLSNYMSLFGPEQNLFGAGMGMGQIGQSGASASANIMARGASVMPNLMSSILGGATMGYMMR